MLKRRNQLFSNGVSLRRVRRCEKAFKFVHFSIPAKQCVCMGISFVDRNQITFYSEGTKTNKKITPEGLIEYEDWRGNAIKNIMNLYSISIGFPDELNPEKFLWQRKFQAFPNNQRRRQGNEKCFSLARFLMFSWIFMRFNFDYI